MVPRASATPFLCIALFLFLGYGTSEMIERFWYALRRCRNIAKIVAESLECSYIRPIGSWVGFEHLHPGKGYPGREKLTLGKRGCRFWCSIRNAPGGSSTGLAVCAGETTYRPS
jgi:hypothetical protein